MTVETRTDLKDNIDTDINDNITGQISAQDVRENMKDSADSAVFPEDLAGNLTVGTGWLAGAFISPNADPAKVDISAGSGVIVDASDPTSISTPILVTWSEMLAVDPEFLATDAVSFMAFNSSGTLVQSVDFPENGDLRTLIQIGGVSHADNVAIDAISNFTSAPVFQLAATITDFMNAMGVINIFGNTFAGSGNANLKFSKDIGKIFFAGIATKTQPQNENHIDTPALDEPDIVFSWRDGSGGHNSKVADAITAGVFDDGTGGASDPNGTVSMNNWVNCRIKYSPDANLAVIEYGDTTHGTSLGARALINDDSYGDNPSYVGFPIRTYITLRGGATNNDIAGDAEFSDTNKFGLI